jgi:gp6-like head-tail connector protein
MWTNHLNPYREPHQPLFRPYVTGPLELVTPPVGQVITLAEAKQQCRIDPDMELDDSFLFDLIDDATEFCEREINGHRQLLSAVYNLPVQHLQFWAAGFRLPRPPLQGGSVAITYYDGGGNILPLDPKFYLVNSPQWQPGTIERAPFTMWPAVQCDRHWPLNVQFTCGYGPGTTIAAPIALGVQTVTPATMQGIFAPGGSPPNAWQGTQLVIDGGMDNREVVTVTSVTSTTFTTNFTKVHTPPAKGGITVTPNIPRTVRKALLMLIATWYRDRENHAAGKAPVDAEETVRRLLSAAEWGSYA